MFSLITLYYQKCNCQPLLIENSAHTWRLKIFKLVFVYAHRLFAFFCLCPPPFFYPPPKKNFLSFPTVPKVQDCRVPSVLPTAKPTLWGRFPIPAAFFFNFSYPRRVSAFPSADLYSWPRMGLGKTRGPSYRKEINAQS